MKNFSIKFLQKNIALPLVFDTGEAYLELQGRIRIIMSAPYPLDILTYLTEFCTHTGKQVPRFSPDVRLHRVFLLEAHHERDKVEAHKNIPHAAHVVGY